MKPTTENKTHKKLGFSYLETAEIVVKLNLLLANYQVHFHRLQNFSWNVKGKHFFELRSKFSEMYERSFRSINTIAERIRIFNQTPVSQMSEAHKIAELEPTWKPLDGESMVGLLKEDLEVLLSFLLETNDMASANGDVGTVDLASTLIKSVEKDHWNLTAWLETYEYSPEPIH